VTIELTPDQIALARSAVQAGRLQSEEDAIHEALGLWEQRERERIAFEASLDDARTSLAGGEGREITPESSKRLVLDVAARGRQRLLAEITKAS